MPLDMNPEVRAEWCKALRSGEYKQGSYRLRAQQYADGYVPIEGEFRYCCLGVLSDLCVKAGVTDWDEIERRVYEQHSTQLLTPEVMVWAGLQARDPELTVPDRRMPVTASRCNDNLSLTFSKIADAIDGGTGGHESVTTA